MNDKYTKYICIVHVYNKPARPQGGPPIHSVLLWIKATSSFLSQLSVGGRPIHSFTSYGSKPQGNF